MMKRWMTRLWILAMTLLMPTIVWAQTATPTPIPQGDLSGALQKLPEIYEAAQSGDWNLVIALALMLAVFAVRSYVWKTLKKRAIPIATAALAAASYTSGALLMGVDLTPAALQGLEVGVSAVGLWELVKAIKGPKKAEEPQAEEPKEDAE